MTLHSVLETAPELKASDYIVLGVATCFLRGEGELEVIKVLEPIPSAYLQTVMQGIPTSYEMVMATTLGALMDCAEPEQITSVSGVRFCENIRDRTIAAARTYQNNGEAEVLLPIGTQRTNLNYSTEKKRVLNLDNIVKAEDNIRQHAYTHKTL